MNGSQLPMGERGPLVSPIPSPQNTKMGAMERSKRLDFPMWDTPPKPMHFMPLVVCVCVRERERGRSSTLHLLERKEKENSHLITRIYWPCLDIVFRFIIEYIVA
jgi:hypothetical protein